MTLALSDIEAADRMLDGNVVRTPFEHSVTLSEITGASVFLKFENRQFTASFKDRGALVRLADLTASQRERGVIALSAGNHAQGVAYRARQMGVPSTIVMPVSTPFGKIGSTELLGATVILHGDSVSEGEAFVQERAGAEGLTVVHPYDDPRIIAGQGTVGLEMLRTVPDLDCLVVPVGGGGLIAGIAVAVKALRPGIRIIGVQAESYPSMHHVLRGWSLPAAGPTIAEGIAVKRPGVNTMPVVRELVEDIVLVSEARLEHAVQLMAEIEKQVVEGAGAASLAALLSEPDRFADQRVGLVVSGGNIDSRLLSSVLMRGLVRSGRLVRIRVETADQPGALARAAQVIAKAGGNIVDVHHQLWFEDVPVKLVEVEFVLETRDADHVERIMAALAGTGMRPERVQAGHSRSNRPAPAQPDP